MKECERGGEEGEKRVNECERGGGEEGKRRRMSEWLSLKDDKERGSIGVGEGRTLAVMGKKNKGRCREEKGRRERKEGKEQE